MFLAVNLYITSLLVKKDSLMIPVVWNLLRYIIWPSTNIIPQYKYRCLLHMFYFIIGSRIIYVLLGQNCLLCCSNCLYPYLFFVHLKSYNHFQSCPLSLYAVFVIYFHCNFVLFSCHRYCSLIVTYLVFIIQPIVQKVKILR